VSDWAFSVPSACPGSVASSRGSSASASVAPAPSARHRPGPRAGRARDGSPIWPPPPSRQRPASSATTSSGIGSCRLTGGVALAGSAVTHGVPAAAARAVPVRGPRGADMTHCPACSGLASRPRGDVRMRMVCPVSGEAGSHAPVGDAVARRPYQSALSGVAASAEAATGTQAPLWSGSARDVPRLAFAGRNGLCHSDSGVAPRVRSLSGVSGQATHSPSLIAVEGVV
jgi:hypothetical protein